MHPKKMKENLVTPELLKTYLDYDKSTGDFFWKIKRTNGIKPGDKAGHVQNSGYISISINGIAYVAHRLAWLFVYGKWPDMIIDHINRIKTDNRIENLREATYRKNAQNRSISKRNTSGHTGVCWHIRDKLWYARINVDGNETHLGVFKNIEDAKQAYQSAAKAANFF